MTTTETLPCAACQHGASEAPPDAEPSDHWLIGFTFASCTPREAQIRVAQHLCERHKEIAALMGGALLGAVRAAGGE